MNHAERQQRRDDGVRELSNRVHFALREAVADVVFENGLDESDYRLSL